MDKILIAEDDRIHLKRLTTIIGKHKEKFKVIPAEDGQEAIEILQKEEVSLLITDIQMPRVDGLQLLAYVNDHHPNLPCFVMTAYGTPQMKAMLPMDLLRFFKKPFDIDDLVLAIIDVLSRDTEREALPGISLISFLYMIEMEQASCTFEVSSPGRPEGTMYFNKGILYDAQCQDLKGEKAAFELISRKNATFKFKFFLEKDITRKIHQDLNHLIRKVMDVSDETSGA